MAERTERYVRVPSKRRIWHVIETPTRTVCGMPWNSGDILGNIFENAADPMCRKCDRFLNVRCSEATFSHRGITHRKGCEFAGARGDYRCEGECVGIGGHHDA